jgi:hypothetical protein
MRTRRCLQTVQRLYGLMPLLPRIIHPKDVKAREIHVAGHDLHFVCGVSAVGNFENETFT